MSGVGTIASVVAWWQASISAVKASLMDVDGAHVLHISSACVFSDRDIYIYILT